MNIAASSRKIFPLFLLLLLFFPSLNAQTFDEVRAAAFGGERAKARTLAKAILAKEFDSDVAVMLGRVYAWDSKYDSARIVLDDVLQRNPRNSEALDALADLEYWDSRYKQALSYCARALATDSVNENFLLKKAKILNSDNQYSQSAQTLKQLLKINPGNSEAIKWLERVRLNQRSNRVSLSYTYDSFDKATNRDPWQLTYLQYTRKTGFGSVIGRVSQARRFETNGTQFEVDAYPRITENQYLYLNVGLSNSSIYPAQRGGFELNTSLPKAFEASLGFRVLHFSGSKRVIIYTGSLGKYDGNYWFSLRPFVTPNGSDASVSVYLLARRYFNDPENYFGLRIGLGSSPDERLKIIQTIQQLLDLPVGSDRLKSQSVKFEFNHLIKNSWIVNAGFAVNNEEYFDNSYLDISSQGTKYGINYTFDINIAYQF